MAMVNNNPGSGVGKNLQTYIFDQVDSRELHGDVQGTQRTQHGAKVNICFYKASDGSLYTNPASALVTFVVDVGHWFEHKRHLQSQVDAGALAGATAFDGCAGASTADRADPASAANTTIQSQVRKYSGDTKHVAAALNSQVNNQ